MAKKKIKPASDAPVIESAEEQPVVTTETETTDNIVVDDVVTEAVDNINEPEQSKESITTRILKSVKRESYWRGGVKHLREWQEFSDLSADAIVRIKADPIIEVK